MSLTPPTLSRQPLRHCHRHIWHAAIAWNYLEYCRSRRRYDGIARRASVAVSPQRRLIPVLACRRRSGTVSDTEGVSLAQITRHSVHRSRRRAPGLHRRIPHRVLLTQHACGRVRIRYVVGARFVLGKHWTLSTGYAHYLSPRLMDEATDASKTVSDTSSDAEGFYGRGVHKFCFVRLCNLGDSQ